MSAYETVTVADEADKTLQATMIDDFGDSVVKLRFDRLPYDQFASVDLDPEAAFRLGSALVAASMRRAR